MSRNSAAIKNKLLDAFNPTLSIQNTTPFRIKDKDEDSTKHKPPSSQMSITRQSYINLEEQLQQDTLNPFTTSQHTSRSLNRSQAKSKRKYIQVISNPHQIFNNSSKTSFMKGSCMLDNRTTAVASGSATALSSKRHHHESCKDLQALASNADSRILQRGPSSSSLQKCSSTFLQTNQRVVSNFDVICNENKSVQLLETSKIHCLQQLVNMQEDKFTKNRYLQTPNRLSNSKEIVRGQSPNQITRAYSLHIQTQTQKPQMYPVPFQQNYQHPQQNIVTNRMPSPLKQNPQSVPINPHNAPWPINPHNNPNNLVFTCVPLNNGQPAFSTIVKKDITLTPVPPNPNPNANLYQATRNPLAIKPNPNKIKIEERYSKCVGKQNQFFAFDTVNMRNQIASLVLK